MKGLPAVICLMVWFLFLMSLMALPNGVVAVGIVFLKLVGSLIGYFLIAGITLFFLTRLTD